MSSAEVQAPARSGRSGLRLSVGIALAWFALDQLTKAWAVRALDDRTIELVWTLQLNLSFNTGFAFSQGRGLGPIIGVVALVTISALLVSLRRNDDVLSAVAVGLVVGGAAGNVADRLFRSGGDGFLHGAVVDFIDFQWFPIFNVADIGVTVGGTLLVLATLRAERGASTR